MSIYKSSECSFSLCWQRRARTRFKSFSSHFIYLNVIHGASVTQHIWTQKRRPRFGGSSRACSERERDGLALRAFNRIFLSRVTDLWVTRATGAARPHTQQQLPFLLFSYSPCTLLLVARGLRASIKFALCLDYVLRLIGNPAGIMQTLAWFSPRGAMQNHEMEIAHFHLFSRAPDCDRDQLRARCAIIWHFIVPSACLMCAYK